MQDAESWMVLAEAVSPRCYVVGDFVYHRAGRLRSEDLPPGYKTSAIVLYPHQLTTVSDISACIQKMTGTLLCLVTTSHLLLQFIDCLFLQSCRYTLWKHFFAL